MSNYAFESLDPLTGLPKKKGGGQQQPLNFRAAYTPPVDYGPTPGGGGSQTPPTLNIPGYNPDWASLILNNPGYRQTMADLGAQGIADAAQLQAAQRKAVIDFGFVPNLDAAGQALVGPGFASNIDDATRQLAASNPFSTQAQLTQQHTKNLRSIRNALAARGALRSGALGYQLGEEQRRLDEGQFTATRQLTDYLAGAQQAFVDAERARQQQQRDAATQAGQQVQNDPANQATPAQKLDWNASVGAYGPGADGKYYDANGNEVTPAGPSYSAPGTWAPTPGSVASSLQTTDEDAMREAWKKLLGY